jgi:hypothetical protein
LAVGVAGVSGVVGVVGVVGVLSVSSDDAGFVHDVSANIRQSPRANARTFKIDLRESVIEVDGRGHFFHYDIPEVMQDRLDL